MIRLYRLLPFVILLAVVIGIAYLIMSFRYTSDRAKSTLIRFLTWLFAILSALLALVTIYALFEHNEPVIELFASALALTVLGLVITRIAKRIFTRNHPNYDQKATKATIVNDSLTTRFTAAFRRALREALRDTFKR